MDVEEKMVKNYFPLSPLLIQDVKGHPVYLFSKEDERQLRAPDEEEEEVVFMRHPSLRRGARREDDNMVVRFREDDEASHVTQKMRHREHGTVDLQQQQQLGCSSSSTEPTEEDEKVTFCKNKINFPGFNTKHCREKVCGFIATGKLHKNLTTAFTVSIECKLSL